MRFRGLGRRPQQGPVGRFVFIHLQKTGGTALLAQFREAFPEGSIFPNRMDGDPITDGPQFKTERMEAAVRERGARLRLVIGHYPYCAVARLPEDFIQLTLLRHPVPRTLSFLRHHRQLHPADQHLSLAELYDDEDRFGPLVRNHMVRMLGMRYEEMTDGMFTAVEMTGDHLDRARANLRRIDAVGLQEQFDEYARFINETFGFRIQRTDPVNVSLPAPGEADSDLVDRIRRDNALDLALYEYAEELVRGRVTSGA